jgi:hypothetical protein
MVGNWQAIGYNDGVAGYPPSRLAAHSKACAKANVAADYESWERGRQLGLKQYCTVNNAYNIGRRGLELNRVCPASSTMRLQQANQQGREYYRLNKQLNDDRALLEEYGQPILSCVQGKCSILKTKKKRAAICYRYRQNCEDSNAR